MCDKTVKEYDLNSTISADDSGIFSCSPSINEYEAIRNFNCELYNPILQKRENTLLLELQVDKLKSELTRLTKSQQWYKQELSLEKTTRLKALERLYEREQNYLENNQRLQKEYERLLVKYNAIEHDLKIQKEKTLDHINVSSNKLKTIDKILTSDQLFELDQQHAIINDQQQLIKLLRKQKHGLLEDMKALTISTDEKVLKLQQTLAVVELENSKMTSKLKQFLVDKKCLEELIKKNDSILKEESFQKIRLQKDFDNLNQIVDSLRNKCVHENTECNQTDKNSSRSNDYVFWSNGNNLDESINFVHLREQKVELKNELDNTYKSIADLEFELITLNDRYANVCVLYEQTKLQVDMLQIEQSKYQYKEEVDNDEISKLKKKLQIYMQQTVSLSERINELETEVEKIIIEKKLKEQQVTGLEDFLKNEQKTKKEEVSDNNFKKEINRTDKNTSNVASNSNDLKGFETKNNYERLEFLKYCLKEQNKKLCLLNQQESDWEEILKAINTIQLIELNTKKELQLKEAELEDLNIIFLDQNKELENLEVMYLVEHAAKKEAETLKTHYERKLADMQFESIKNEKELKKLKSILKTVESENKNLHRKLSIRGQSEYEKSLVKSNTEVFKTNFFNSSPMFSSNNEKIISKVHQNDKEKEIRITEAKISRDFEMLLEECNLIDDNKKLIKKSSSLSGRLNTTALVALMEESNKYMPTFKNLEYTLEQLRFDVHQAKSVINSIKDKKYQTSQSLMDEIKAVECNLQNLK